ncbi:MAG: hypothetical protein Q9195_006416 [Heterodermia aff. obscurata]
MAPRQTRGAAAKAAAVIASAGNTNDNQQLSNPPSIPVPVPAGRKGAASGKASSSKKNVFGSSTKANDPFKALATPASVGKKRKQEPLIDNKEEDLPHGLGKSLNKNPGQVKDENSDQEKPAAEKLLATSKTTSISKAKADDIIADAVAKVSSSKSPKKPTNYGHTPGKTPYPNWPHPTVEECQFVHDLLTEVHGLFAPPETIPAPSATFAGCGEVPSVLDALIRTYLSSSTMGANSGKAIQGIHQTFKQLDEGTGKGSPDYNDIRLKDTSVLFKAIASGGLGDVKSKNIKAILDMVYEENQAHRDAYKKRQETGTTGEVDTEDGTITVEKSAELTCADPNVLSLDHMHALSDAEAFTTFLTYPGIGVKTAACVLLFCMKRPLFAVDTHVYRLCQWLGWVPDKATRDKTFSHCEVMIPDKLKYGLHQLFIKHGQTCGRCKKATGEQSEGWKNGCVIEHLVKRTGANKGGEDSKVKKGKKGDEDLPVKKGKKGKKGVEGPPAKKAKKGKGKKIIEENETEASDEDHEEGPPAKKAKKGKGKEKEIVQDEEASFSDEDYEEMDEEIDEETDE